MKTIVICSSADFYKHVIDIVESLEQLGFKAIMPFTAHKMLKSSNFKAEDYRTWLKNPKDFDKKRYLMDRHFQEVADGDAILVVNDEKHGKPGYIGANVLMEMALAYYLKKPVFILNQVTKDNTVYEEVMGMGAIILCGKLEAIKL